MKVLILVYIILLFLWIFEFMLYHQKKVSFVLITAFLMTGSVILVSRFPFLLCTFLGLAYFWNHRHLIKEEKVYGLGVTAVYLYLTYCAYGSLLQAGITAAGLTVLLEYITLRIMKREEDSTIIYQNKLMKQQIDEIENMYLTMRGWRHDYHNHLQSLKGFLKLGEYDQIENYLKNLETDLDSIDTLYHSGNIQVDAILNAKLAIAEKNQIQIRCDAQVPPALHVSELDLCVMIGNLLDNAIESCKKIENPQERFIRIYLDIMKQQLYISVTNATGESVKVRTDAYFTQKRGDHGHGLRRVDQVVKKYEGYLNRQNEPGVFATEILLPL